MRKNHRKTPGSISQDLLLLWKPPNYGHCHIVQCLWQTGGRVSCNRIKPNDVGDILFNNVVIINSVQFIYMYITGSVSAHGAVKPLAIQVIFIPNYPHSSLQLYVHLTLKVLFLGVFYMVNYSITWEETLANLCSALTGIKLITFLSKASTTELNDWVHTIITM